MIVIKMQGDLKIISGSANPQLAEEVSSYLNIPLTPIDIIRFNDDEIYCKIKKSVRGSNIFLIQPTCPNSNENLMELLIMIDALKRASAKEITAVIPYFGYARQDRKATEREPITAKLVANLITVAGADRVVTFDLHVDQLQGFFDIPLDNLEAIPLIADYLLDKKLKNSVVVSPDVGGAKRADKLSKLINASLAIIDKRRPRPGEAKILNVIGDVEGKNVVIIDDIIDSGGTMLNAAKKVKELGAKKVFIAATHAVFSKDAAEIMNDKAIDEVIVTNSIPLKRTNEKIKVISVAPMLAESLKRIYEGQPMGVFFDGIYDRIKKKREELL